MSEHGVTSVDMQVRGYPGTQATCRCGWKAQWGVRDGSAEADGHAHMLAVDPQYRKESEERHAAWLAENAARLAARPAPPITRAPLRAPHRHNCSCHLSAPCGACENCNHPDGDYADECPDDCQECEVDHEQE